VLNLFDEILSGEGYRVSTQPYIDKDLDHIVAIAPDLIILDYMWAGEDDGWSLLQMLKMDRRTAPIPAIVCTGAVREVEALRPHLEQMQVQVILKPFDIDSLLDVIRSVLPAAESPK
jgi:CheY-like chemotaxis protein